MPNIFITSINRDTPAMVDWLRNYQIAFKLTDGQMANLIGMARQRWLDIRRGQNGVPGAQFREHARLRFGPNFWNEPLPAAPITLPDGYPGHGWGVSAPSGQDCGGDPGPSVSPSGSDANPANTAAGEDDKEPT